MKKKFKIPLSKEIQEVISETQKKESHYFSTAFREKEKEDPGKGWDFLEQIFNFHFKPNNPVEPFQPMLIMGDKRSLIPNDLLPNQIRELQNTLKGVEDPEYRARIGDIIWVSSKDHEAAKIAVEAYLESGKRLEDPDHWVDCLERYERGVRLASQLGKENSLRDSFLQHIEERIFFYNGEDPLYFSLKTAEILLNFNFGDFERISKILGKIARKSKKLKDFRRARAYFHTQSKILKKAKKFVEAEAAQISFAECYFSEAEEREKEGSFLVAHHFWQETIKAYKKIPTLNSQIPSLQKRLAEVGKKAQGEMKKFSHEIDIGDAVKETEKLFKGLSFDEAFFQFLTFVNLIDPQNLKELVEKTNQEYPLQASFQADIFDAIGRKIGIRPSVLTDNPNEREEAILGFMDDQARFQREILVSSRLFPALRTILSEHEVEETEIFRLIGNSGIIPPGRTEFFLKAILEGFNWSFSSALHFFIPQIENSFRFMLETQGVVPRNFNEKGIEEVWGTERCLKNQTLRKALGESWTYELETLLGGRLGPNLRNLLAHGLLSPGDLNGPTAIYCWWVLLRFTASPTPEMQNYLKRIKEKNSQKG